MGLRPTKDVVPIIFRVVVWFGVCVGLLGCLAWGMKLGVAEGWKSKCAPVELHVLLTAHAWSKPNRLTVRSDRDDSQERSEVDLTDVIGGALARPLQTCGDPPIDATIPYVRLLASLAMADAATKRMATAESSEPANWWQRAEAACREAGGRDCSRDALRKMADVALFHRGTKEDGFDTYVDLLKKACPGPDHDAKHLPDQTRALPTSPDRTVEK